MATLDPSTLTLEPARLEIGVLERGLRVQQRTARIIGAASHLDWIAAEQDPAILRARLGEGTRLLACDGTDLELVIEWTRSVFTSAHVIAWSHTPLDALVPLAIGDDRIVSLLGWPMFESTPRVWEIALATRTILWPGFGATTPADIFAGTPIVVELHPRTFEDRDRVVHTVAELSERAGAGHRAAQRIGEIAHELVGNATYDAPVDASGEVRYARDRRARVTLEEGEVPTVVFATDGMLVVLQVTDPFGRLTREHVLAGIDRGRRAVRSSATDVVDASMGGAGLGLWRVYSSSAATIVDTVPGRATTVTAVFDIDLAPREARTLPPSLHLFDRGRLG
jgi:hypothetical protein